MHKLISASPSVKQITTLDLSQGNSSTLSASNKALLSKKNDGFGTNRDI
jgi:hypothetical protein